MIDRIKLDRSCLEVKEYYPLDEFPKIIAERLDQIDKDVPYSLEDYKKARRKGLDLDNWQDYEEFFGLGEEPEEY